MTLDELKAKLDGLGVHAEVATDAYGEPCVRCPMGSWGLVNDFPNARAIPAPKFTATHAYWKLSA